VAGQACDRAARMTGRADAFFGRYFGRHMVRVANYRPASDRAPGARVPLK
jgi:hypothetical protein